MDRNFLLVGAKREHQEMMKSIKYDVKRTPDIHTRCQGGQKGLKYFILFQTMRASMASRK
jgi:hypothetical protein